MFVVQPLNQEHRFDSFDCGKAELDSWLRRSALQARRNNTASTFVWCEEGALDVAAYYSFAALTVVRDDLPKKLQRGNLDRVPSVLLGRLALDRRYQGRGIGQALLVDAFRTALRGNEIFAARFFVVDALDEQAFLFYQKHGFHEVPETMRLYRKMSDIAKTIEHFD